MRVHDELTVTRSPAEELEVVFDPAHLVLLRSLLDKPAFKPLLMAGFIQLRVVVDANCVVQSLIYRERNPACPSTALEEAIKSTVLEVYAPRWLDEEMRSAIAQAAEIRNLSPDALAARWEQLRPQLKWDDSLTTPTGQKSDSCDPKDEAYVELEQKISAAGILSQDKHIRRLGGHPLDHAFLLNAKKYARAAGVSVGIRIGGVFVSALTLKVAAEAVRGLGKLFSRLPPATQGLLVLGGVAVLLHPRSRRWLTDRLALLMVEVQPALRALLGGLTHLAAISAESQGRADTHLRQIRGALRPSPIRYSATAQQ